MYSRGKLGLAEFNNEERAVFKPVRQRLVRRHPVSGRKSLFLSAHAGEIEGMPTPQARMLLLDLTEFATRERFVYSHVDLVMWDNRTTMHRGRRFDPNEARDSTLSKEPYPFPDIWDPLFRIFDAWGFDRCLWGTDWTRAFAVVH
jgi:alpha-ketoglutarate-dependent 2,4-dichlorophenoxyacetate dioxygenase